MSNDINIGTVYDTERDQVIRDYRQAHESQEKARRDNVIFTIVRFAVSLFSYIFTALTAPSFKVLCIGLLVICCTIASDILILLLTEKLNKIQFCLCAAFFSFILLLIIFFIMVSLDFIVYDGMLNIVNTALNQKILAVPFNPMYIHILMFTSICIYIFEYTGVLRRSKVIP